MEIFLTLAFLFMVGSLLGWVLELFFRRFFTAKRWINPGFLTGPCLPIYGFGLASLYAMSRIDLSFIENIYLQKITLFIIMTIIVTLIEYIGGLIFIKGLKTKLWDYSKRWGNIQGIICPLFTLFWFLESMGYNLLLDKYVVKMATWFTNNIMFSFFVGVFFGIMVVDLAMSIGLASKIKNIAKEYNIVVKWESLKQSIAMKKESLKEKVQFITPFKNVSLKESIQHYIEQFKDKDKSK